MVANIFSKTFWLKLISIKDNLFSGFHRMDLTLDALW